MKPFLLLLLTLISFVHSQTLDSASIRPTPLFEAGVLVGEPVGVSVKLWHTTVTATDAAAAWSFSEDGVFEMHIDFLLHPFNLRAFTGGNNFPAYIGPGFAARVGDDWFLGARLPIGVEYLLNSFPISFFGEVAPQWQFVPDSKFVMSGGLGARITFGSIQ